MLKVRSFIRSGIELSPVEVEVSFIKGLPQLQVMGLPDAIIRESQLRIKSALKQQGFDWPKARQVLVNLRPSHLKKSSRGLDLAIAAAYLWKSKQVQAPEGTVYLYGELGLEGKVYMPDDFDSLIHHNAKYPIYSGPPKGPQEWPLLAVHELKGLEAPEFLEAQKLNAFLARPKLENLRFGELAAEIMAVVATGEHSLMLAGPAGTGKTTFAQSLYQILDDPDSKTFRVARQVGKMFGRNESWRPWVSPHHTSTPQAMIGGGTPTFPGEITRAHGGLLVLDEFLEFPQQVKEALREPIERGEITVCRAASRQTYPAQFMLMATTNFCPCGDYIPGKSTNCRFSLVRCRSYLEKLSGPILDRFETVAFTDEWQSQGGVLLETISTKVQKAQLFAKRSRGQTIKNSQLSTANVENQVNSFIMNNLMPETGSSRRRRLALLRVARTFADLDSSKSVKVEHIEQAKKISLLPFIKIKHLQY